MTFQDAWETWMWTKMHFLSSDRQTVDSIPSLCLVMSNLIISTDYAAKWLRCRTFIQWS